MTRKCTIEQAEAGLCDESCFDADKGKAPTIHPQLGIKIIYSGIWDIFKYKQWGKETHEQRLFLEDFYKEERQK